MSASKSGSSQETAAAKGGFSVRSGRRIEKGEHQPQRVRPHDWRTRVDPPVWRQSCHNLERSYPLHTTPPHVRSLLPQLFDTEA